MTTTKCSASFISCANILIGKLAVQSVLQFVHYCLSKRVRSSGVAKDLVTQMKTLRRLGLARATLQHFLVPSTFAVVRQAGVVAFVDSQFTTFLHISQALRPSAELRSDLCRKERLLLIGIV